MTKDRRRTLLSKNVRKPSTNKSLDKITYCPAKHKQKFVKKLRQQLQKVKLQDPSCPPKDASILKFASWNIGGLDPGTHEALDSIILSEGLHVRDELKITIYTCNVCRSLQLAKHTIDLISQMI